MVTALRRPLGIFDTCALIDLAKPGTIRDEFVRVMTGKGTIATTLFGLNYLV